MLYYAIYISNIYIERGIALCMAAQIVYAMENTVLFTVVIYIKDFWLYALFYVEISV